VGLKVDAAREILTVIMKSNDENVRLCKTHSSLSCILFLAIACPFLASQLTTMSLDCNEQPNANEITSHPKTPQHKLGHKTPGSSFQYLASHPTRSTQNSVVLCNSGTPITKELRPPTSRYDSPLLSPPTSQE